jgi:osmotically-inducible protein OsmY
MSEYWHFSTPSTSGVAMYFWWFTDRYNPSAISHWAASSAAPHTARERRSADEHLLDAVARSLLADEAITGGHLHLRAQNGVVILDGEIDTEDTRAAVSERVWAVPGVTDVCDALRVTGRRYLAD